MKNRPKWLSHLSNISIKDFFSEKVERVSIEYQTTFVWFGGREIESHALSKDKTGTADFLIKCPNEECTEGYMDLREEVFDTIRRGLATCAFCKRCSGRTAPDHPHQSCDVLVEGSISIQYAQSDKGNS